MKILIIDLNREKNSIFKDEFVRPIEQILKSNEIEFETKHFLDEINFDSSQTRKVSESLGIVSVSEVSERLRNRANVISCVSEKKNSLIFDKIILGGTPLKEFNYLNHLDKFEWIKNTKKPILGICAGCQIIGKIFGADLIYSKEIGMIEISKIKENILFEETNFNAYSLHNKSLTNLSKFEILAKSDKSIEAIKHKQKEIYGVLFHPEIKNPQIILNFIKNN